MKPLRVVLYAEGARETGSAHRRAPTPLHPLPEERLGPAHVLVRRAVRWALREAERPVAFLAPLRLPSGQVPTGSDLIDPAKLRKLLAYPGTLPPPELTVVLVDADGEVRKRRKLLERCLREPSRPVPAVVGIAVEEFEAWWLADNEALGEVLGTPVPRSKAKLKPGVAKQKLHELLARDGEPRATPSRRATLLGELAERIDLERLRSRSGSFETFLEELRAVLVPPS